MKNVILGYKLIEIASNRLIKTYKATQGGLARNRRDKLDINYGAINHKVETIVGSI